MKKKSDSAPLTFDAPESLIAKIEKLAGKEDSKSAVVRRALEAFDIDRYKPVTEGHRQMSVRIDGKLKSKLLKGAKAKKVSIGEILRAAIDALPAKKGR